MVWWNKNYICKLDQFLFGSKPVIIRVVQYYHTSKSWTKRHQSTNFYNYNFSTGYYAVSDLAKLDNLNATAAVAVIT
jgi:hypothetical protein